MRPTKRFHPQAWVAQLVPALMLLILLALVVSMLIVISAGLGN